LAGKRIEPGYRLLALDLDGTLIGADLVVGDTDRRALQAARAVGVEVVIATGRGFPFARQYATALGLEAPIICYQGALVQDPLSDEVLYRAELPAGAYAEAVAWADRAALDFTVYVGNRLFLNKFRRPREFYEHWFGMPIEQASDLVTGLPQPPAKFVISAEETDADAIEREWKARFDGRLQIVRSHPLFVEGTPSGVSKGAALARVAGHLDVAREAVIAVGDNDNDRSMIEWAGLGVAMASAPEALKAAADYVAPCQPEAGVAHVVEEFVLRHA
jgi:Cof subfamily protein (haloacid dehalogenase superfamily)